MNAKTSLLLVGVGGAGCAAARDVRRLYGKPMNLLLVDTDAGANDGNDPFLLLGGTRLSGKGSGGDYVKARMATLETLAPWEEAVRGARLVVVLTSLGGGTGGGSTIALAQNLREKGIPSIVFATLPFAMEGAQRARTAEDVVGMIEKEASASFFTPLDRLVEGEDNMAAALGRATHTLAAGVTLFWRLLETPGYIRLDPERLRALVASVGRGRFAAAEASGDDRAERVLHTLVDSPLLAGESAGSILCGVLAGDDLRLKEIDLIAKGVQDTFGENAGFTLATVNDEATFSGRLAVVALLFDKNAIRASAERTSRTGASRQRKARSVLHQGHEAPFGKGEPTLWEGKEIDTPTYLRRNIALEP
jgi:cell division protein FtsZ